MQERLKNPVETEISTKLLLVDGPSPERDAMVAAAEGAGVVVRVMDDAMQALAEVGTEQPTVVLIGQDPGPPGATSLSRILGRKLNGVQIYRLGEPGARGVLASEARCLPAALSAYEIISKVVPGASSEDAVELRLSEAAVESLQFPQVLVGCARSYFTGRIWIYSDRGEAEVSLMGGLAVASRDTVPEHRFGQVAMQLGVVNEECLFEGLERARARGLRLGQALFESEKMSGEQLHRVLCEQHMRRMSALCLAGPVRIRISPELGAQRGEGILRIHPWTAILRAVADVGEEERQAFIGPLADASIGAGQPCRQADRYLAALGISDLDGMLVHCKTVAALRSMLVPALSVGASIGPDRVLLLLLWSGRIVVDAKRNGEEMASQRSLELREIPTGRLTGLLSLTPFEADQLWSAEDGGAWELPAELSDYLQSDGEVHRPRGNYPVEGPAVECSPELSDFLGRYHTDLCQTSPLGVLGIARMGARPAGGTDTGIRRAYLDALASLDDLPSGPDDYSVVFRRANLRELYTEAYEALGGIESAPGDDHDALANGLQAGAQQVDAQGEEAAHGTGAGFEANDDPAVGHEDAGEGDAGEGDAGAAEASEGVAQGVAPSPAGATDAVHAHLIRELEVLVQQGRWTDLLQRVAAEPQPMIEQPDSVRLLCAVALRESQEAGAAASEVSPEQLAIGALSRLLGVHGRSAVSLVLAKRMLRRRPIEWNKRPTGKASLAATLVALVIGASVGLALQHLGLLSLDTLLIPK